VRNPQGPVSVFNATFRRVYFPIDCGWDTMTSCIVIISAVVISQKRETLVNEYTEAIHEDTVTPLLRPGTRYDGNSSTTPPPNFNSIIQYLIPE
jgi:hypothetical protein